ncbi:succinylglutamate desuccinylase/aspartoacylase family protein [Tropicimonas sp. IMCC6043]|uniref:succinylglutamate desuccinylase/aspartoacylase family protein n=1 Tax=Tropicimonas sp. IMCC6043 TaxID=2510645 RepID=UPI00101CC59E|nr:succinylglutamate desuccinylase/aspartoacylase family protein [Tropicimonas sp. IMCC6043]RYH09619.1 succinylglutamate desuccinylase/aspartoacylase family protein [Tropicimonas sp. IMCC6043]
MAARQDFEIGGFHIRPGARRTVELPVSMLSDHTPVTMSIHVVHGRREGATLFVSAAVHGDEVIGVEIARRLLRSPQLDRINGTLIVIPIVNSFGFYSRSRYLPDRRDLNRSFPGSETGSLASRMANLFMTEVVSRCDLGIDLHSAAIHRTNMPQIRVSPGRPETLRYANAFGAPLVMRSKIRAGSLRGEAQRAGVDILLYEAGEGLRFDEFSARAGVAGILRVMHELGMIPEDGVPLAEAKPVVAHNSFWERAAAGGLLRTFKSAGEWVEADELLGIISDPFGETEVEARAATPGLIIGRTNLPVINEGDALFHIATVTAYEAESRVESLSAQLEEAELFDEDEII